MSLHALWVDGSDYARCLQAMADYTSQRSATSPDFLWLTEHPSLYTQGQAGKAEHLLQASQIPVIQADRGGQVTYHGPGQLVLYVLLDLKRANIGVRQLVTTLEQAMIAVLKQHGIEASARADAPGVYVDSAKIGALGLRVRRGATYHGLALNVAMDLAPYGAINPCGYPGLAVVDMASLQRTVSLDTLGAQLCAQIASGIGYTQFSGVMRDQRFDPMEAINERFYSALSA